MLEFSVLASGSSGNSVYIRSQSTSLLLDAGISGRQLQRRLESTVGVQLDSIHAVLVTHEHVDHVRGLRQIARLTQADIYATEGTWQHIATDVADEEAADRIVHVRAEHTFTVGDIRITPFAVSHDAEEPVAYRFDCGDRSLAVVTDLGYVSDRIKEIIAGCQAYVWETNHDVDMLRVGRYPWSVKRRILGDKGHLSNYDAAVALADILGDTPVDIYLAHLSEENNQPDLAELTVDSVLRELCATYREQVTLLHTSRVQATPLRSV